MQKIYEYKFWHHIYFYLTFPTKARTEELFATGPAGQCKTMLKFYYCFVFKTRGSQESESLTWLKFAFQG